jgi:hypothetical protein
MLTILHKGAKDLLAFFRLAVVMAVMHPQMQDRLTREIRP